MSSSFGTIAARRRQPLSRRSLASEPAANQRSTSRFAGHAISTTTNCGLLKQPDNQKLPRFHLLSGAAVDDAQNVCELLILTPSRQAAVPFLVTDNSPKETRRQR